MLGHPSTDCWRKKVWTSVLPCATDGSIHYSRRLLASPSFSSAKLLPESSIHTSPKFKFKSKYTPLQEQVIYNICCISAVMVCGISCFLRVYFNLTNPTFSTGVKAQSESSGIDWSISDKLDISKIIRGVHSIRESITTVPAQQISCKNHTEKEKFISIYYLYLYWKFTVQFNWTGRNKLVESNYCWQIEEFCLPYFA